MSTDIATAAEFHLTDWWDKNKQNIIYGAGAVLVIALAVSLYLWHKNQNETNASEALSMVEAGPGAAQSYLKIANDYQGTPAAARASLLAAGSSFSEGRYSEAQGLFEKFLKEFPEDPSRVAALMGVATCLDAQGKGNDAIAKYKEVVERYPSDAAVPAAKSALARLYESQGQFAPALSLYQELVRAEQNTSYGLESMVRAESLLAKHPELAKAMGTNSAAAKIP